MGSPKNENVLMWLRNTVKENASPDLDRIAATQLRLTLASRRARYLPAVSPSSLTGTAKASLLRWKEFGFDDNPGVPG